MDPVSLSLAIAPLVLSSAKLLGAVRSVRQRYKDAQTAVNSTQSEYELMHVALCEVQGLVHRSRVELAVRLRSHRSLEESFDKVLMGCRITLDALHWSSMTYLIPQRVVLAIWVTDRKPNTFGRKTRWRS